MLHSNSQTFENVETELCALNLPERDREEILGSVREKAARAWSSAVDAGAGPERLAIARRIQRMRLCGNRIMGANIMRDPKFEMLLELYIAHHEHRRVCVSTLCAATTAPATTGLRHIDALERQGFLTRADDWTDARRSWLTPTDRTLGAVERYVDEFRRPN